MSTHCVEGRDSGSGEGANRRSVLCFPGKGCWDAGEHPADCHEMWSAIILAFGLHAFCRECWSFSGIRGFLFMRKFERKEKT